MSAEEKLNDILENLKLLEDEFNTLIKDKNKEVESLKLRLNEALKEKEEYKDACHKIYAHIVGKIKNGTDTKRDG